MKPLIVWCGHACMSMRVGLKEGGGIAHGALIMMMSGHSKQTHCLSAPCEHSCSTCKALPTKGSVPHLPQHWAGCARSAMVRARARKSMDDVTLNSEHETKRDTCEVSPMKMMHDCCGFKRFSAILLGVTLGLPAG